MSDTDLIIKLIENLYANGGRVERETAEAVEKLLPKPDPNYSNPDMKEEPPGFRDWVNSLPDKHWARYDLSACFLGWKASTVFAMSNTQPNDLVERLLKLFPPLSEEKLPGDQYLHLKIPLADCRDIVACLKLLSPVLPEEVEEAIKAIDDAANTGMKEWPNSVVVPVMNLVSLVQRLARENEKLKSAVKRITPENLRNADNLRSELDACKRANEYLQAKIDALMFEYCPDEMTPEQIAEWGRNQAPSEQALKDGGE